jgi:hypothetical protein
MIDKPRSFSPDRLWEFIDGAADAYLAYGFEEAVSVEYAQAGAGCRALLDVYRMKDALGAFGIYTRERNPDYRFLEIGNEGYLAGMALNFWAGPYYVKITAFEDKDAVREQMGRLAAAVAAKVTSPGKEPAEAAYFPTAGQVPRSLVYIPRDVLGQSYLPSGFEAKYRAGEHEFRMILVVLAGEDAAREAMVRHRQFMAAGGKSVSELAAPGQGGFISRDGGGSFAAVRSGTYIATVLNAPSEDQAKQLAAELVSKIK